MSGIVAQRALRFLCPKCQEKETIPRERLKELGIPIAGSIGRAATLGVQTIPTIRPNNTPRDVDIINIGQHASSADLLPHDMEFDRVWLNSFVRAINGGYELIYPGSRSEPKNITPKVVVPVPHLEQVIEPVINIKINGQNCLILKPDAQLAFDKMLGRPQPKNAEQLKLLEQHVRDLPVSQRTDPALLQPFQDFSHALDRLIRRKLYCSAREAYYSALPDQLSQIALPALKQIARRSKLI